MTKLSNIETKLLDNYVIANNYTEFSEAHFFSALSNIVPTWRLEQIAGLEKLYKFETSKAYEHYIKELYA